MALHPRHDPIMGRKKVDLMKELLAEKRKLDKIKERINSELDVKLSKIEDSLKKLEAAVEPENLNGQILLDYLNEPSTEKQEQMREKYQKLNDWIKKHGIEKNTKIVQIKTDKSGRKRKRALDIYDDEIDYYDFGDIENVDIESV